MRPEDDWRYVFHVRSTKEPAGDVFGGFGDGCVGKFDVEKLYSGHKVIAVV